MKILITGSNGFIAKELIFRLERNGHEIIATNRDSLDVLDSYVVDKFFNKNTVDVVIHCAISGGRRNQHDTPHVLHNNKLMFESLVRHRDKYGLMITFGSGTEKDKYQNIHSCLEEEFVDQNKSIPADYYGLSKYAIAKRIYDINDNILNLRIFNVFGEYEATDRMIKANIINYCNKKPIEIHKDRTMDFVGAEDLYRVVEYYINCGAENVEGRSINISYEKKTTLQQVAQIINSLSSHKSQIIIKESGMGPSYCGDGRRLHALDLNLIGLEASLKQVYNKWKE
jgi:nucleoside-diphosphate-sugar epimerase